MTKTNRRSVKQKSKGSKVTKVAGNGDLKLNSKMYFGLLTFQLLNLLTLVLQFNLVYLLFAIFALTLQFIVHFKTFRKTASKSNSAVNLYTSPKILPSWVILVLALSGSVGIALAGQTLGLLLSMIHLLCFAYSLKLFEITSRKDLYQLVVLGVFVATSSLIFIQSIYFSIAVIVLVLANFWILIHYFAPTIALHKQTKLLAKLSLYSVPLAIVLFVAFPKLSPFWQVPNVESAKVGLSDSVKIGDISQLALSDELAFRVSFQGDNPEHAQLYWRAMVLDDFDGVTWRQEQHNKGQKNTQRYGSARLSNANKSSDIAINGVGLAYQVIAEPSFQSWLFALDFATSEQSNIGQRNDYALFYRGIISQTLSYKVTSYPKAILAPTLSDESRALNLALSTDNNPKLLAKAQQLRKQYSEDRSLINHVLAEFNQQDYFYTLQPPKLTNNSLDEFYFDTKAGFCEHYASTFTYLMRAAGIPSRMVVGYLGGELNPNGNYLSVYQRNAHAWSEVWLPESGWQRVDPTSAVDSERVERGFSSNLIREYSNLSSGIFSLQSLRTMQWYQELKMQIDAIDYQWTRWVIGYTGQKQSHVMAQIMASLKQGKNIAYFMLILIGLALFVYMFKSVQVKSKSQDRIKEWYLKTLALLARHNLVKVRSMTAQQFVHFVDTTHPELSVNFTIISNAFTQLAYQDFDEINQQTRDKHLTEIKSSYRHLWFQLWLNKWQIK